MWRESKKQLGLINLSLDSCYSGANLYRLEKIGIKSDNVILRASCGPKYTSL